MFLFRLAPLMALAAASLAHPPAAIAQTKVATISFQRALLETAEMKKAQSEMEAKYGPRQEQLQTLQREIQQLQQQLQSMAGKLQPQAEAELSAQIQRKQRELQRENEDLQSDVDEERSQILQASNQRMLEVVQKLAEEKGLDVVIDTANIVYAKPAVDITSEATAAYDKAYPVATPSASNSPAKPQR